MLYGNHLKKITFMRLRYAAFLRFTLPQTFRLSQASRLHNTRHLLHDILLLTLGARISGADSWTQAVEYGPSKLDWFQEFLELPNGIPSHDTFGRLFARRDPQGLHDFFTRWVSNLCRLKPSPSMAKPCAAPGEKRLAGA
jgi:hypothetical protein